MGVALNIWTLVVDVFKGIKGMPRGEALVSNATCGQPLSPISRGPAPFISWVPSVLTSLKLSVQLSNMAFSNFKVVPCELSDMAVCADIFDEAFADDPAIIYLYPRSDPKVLKEKSIQNFGKSFTAPGVKYFKAILEETGYVLCLLEYLPAHTC